jgi:hypothetical protein
MGFARDCCANEGKPLKSTDATQKKLPRFT